MNKQKEYKCPKCKRIYKFERTLKFHLLTCDGKFFHKIPVKATDKLKLIEKDYRDFRCKFYELEDSFKDLEIEFSFNKKLIKEYKKENLSLQKKLRKSEDRCEELINEKGFNIIKKLENEKDLLKAELKAWKKETLKELENG